MWLTYTDVVPSALKTADHVIGGSPHPFRLARATGSLGERCKTSQYPCREPCKILGRTLQDLIRAKRIRHRPPSEDGVSNGANSRRCSMKKVFSMLAGLAALVLSAGAGMTWS
jgi:hypothetical protein